MLTKAIKNLLAAKAEKIETTQDLRTKCLDREICALLLKGAKTSPNYVKTAMEKLLVEYPQVAFAAVDTSVLYIKGLEAEYLTEFQPDRPRFAVFEKVAGSSSSTSTAKSDNNKNSSRLKTSVVTLRDSVAYGPMSNLIASVIQKTATMQKVSSLPTIKTRTKKLEQEERAKRQRRQEQQYRQHHQHDTDSSSGGGGGRSDGYFSTGGENDGSRDGRRAERERRRAEHRANNPNFKEKTPEEIAEMEQQRRRRMEEEAAKWNVAPEDASEEGSSWEPIGDNNHDDTTTTMDWDDEQDQESARRDERSGSWEHDGDNDEEDVMDLDE
jgi:hypothetical protein